MGNKISWIHAIVGYGLSLLFIFFAVLVTDFGTKMALLTIAFAFTSATSTTLGFREIKKLLLKSDQKIEKLLKQSKKK